MSRWEVERVPRVMNKPEPGLWAIRLRKGGVEVAARIFLCDHEPGHPGNKLDQPFMDAEINGERVHPDRIWHTRGRPIDEAEYQYLLKVYEWARQHAPNDPAANPHQPVDWLTAPIPSFTRSK